jgi:maltose alpha-D-glucosyltransferase / alpha-amylase
MPHYLQRVFWFCGRGRVISQISVFDTCRLEQDDQLYLLTFLQVTYTEHDPEIYLIPLTWLSCDRLQALTDRHPLATITALSLGDTEGVLCDAIYLEEFRDLLLELMIGRAKVHGANGSELLGLRGGGVTKTSPPRAELFPSRVATVQQNNTSVMYGDRLLFKMYRRQQEGIHPEPEILRFLVGNEKFRNVPSYAGGMQYRTAGGKVYDLGVLQTYISCHGDAWRSTLTSLSQFVEHLLSHRQELPKLPAQLPTLLEVVERGIPDQFRDLVRGLHLEMALLLGKRTAEMHRALAFGSTESTWKMEAFSTLYQRSIFQSMRGLIRRNFQLLKENLENLPHDVQRRAASILAAEKEILAYQQKITGRRLSAMKCRIHGDFHLGQALFTGKDFIFIDFEGYRPVLSANDD